MSNLAVIYSKRAQSAISFRTGAALKIEFEREIWEYAWKFQTSDSSKLGPRYGGGGEGMATSLIKGVGPPKHCKISGFRHPDALD